MTDTAPFGAPRRVLLAASTGGHLEQLNRISAKYFADADRHWVTFDHPQSRTLLAGESVEFVPEIPSRGLAQLLRATPAFRSSIRSFRPDTAVSTGAAIAGMMLPMAARMGANAHYVESVARHAGPSITGRLLALDRRVSLHTQHREWATTRWVPDVSILDDYELIHNPAPISGLRIFVTLGTIRYPFDALVRRLVDIAPANSEFVWQLGSTSGASLPGEVNATMSISDIDQAISWSNVVVSHAGVGSSLRALDVGRFPILVPRRKSRGEHVDDHQEQIAFLLHSRGLARVVEAPELCEDDLTQSARTIVRSMATEHGR